MSAEDYGLEEALLADIKNRLPAFAWEEMKQKVFARDVFCVSCCSDKYLEVDHKVALCLGGTNNLNNLQLLCSVCHIKKTKEDVTKFARLKKFKQGEKRIGGFN